MYMYINFQQNRVNRSIIIVHKCILKNITSCINLQLYNNNIFFNRLFQTCIIVKGTRISIFNKIGLVDQSKPCAQIYLQKKNCKLQKFNSNFEKSRLSDMHYPLTDIQANFEISNYREKKLFYCRQTDRRTDGQTSRTTTIGSFFEKKKKNYQKSNNVYHRKDPLLYMIKYRHPFS